MIVIATEFSSLFTGSLGEARRVKEDLNIFLQTLWLKSWGRDILYLILYHNISIATGFHSGSNANQGWQVQYTKVLTCCSLIMAAKIPHSVTLVLCVCVHWGRGQVIRERVGPAPYQILLTTSDILITRSVWDRWETLIWTGDKRFSNGHHSNHGNRTHQKRKLNDQKEIIRLLV